MTNRYPLDDLAAARDAGVIDAVTSERLTLFLAQREAPWGRPRVRIAGDASRGKR
jgi:hypothetical protein